MTQADKRRERAGIIDGQRDERQVEGEGDRQNREERGRVSLAVKEMKDRRERREGGYHWRSKR